MRIEEDIKLDYKDVLIRPKRSTLSSRREVDITRDYQFRWSGKSFSGVPVVAANMDGVGTMAMAEAFREMGDGLTVALINFGIGVVVTCGAWALGLDAPIMWGGLAALLNFRPYIGPLTMVGLLALFGIGTNASPLVGAIPALCYLGLHAIESNVVTPSILGARFTMNPVLILLALSYFTWVWGFTGALLSVPILLTLTALVDHLGKPNLIGFIFGEPLFASDPLESGEGPADEAADPSPSAG